MQALKYFRCHQDGDTLVIKPLCDIGRLSQDHLQQDLGILMLHLERAGVQNSVIDFSNVSCFGTSMLASLLRLWKQVRDRGGFMALANLSPEKRSVLKVTHLDKLWRCEPEAGKSAPLRFSA